MDLSSFRNIYNVCFYLISFIIKIPKIFESRVCPSDRTAVSAHVPVFEHSETQYPHNGRVIYRAPRNLINITFMSYYLQEVFINPIFRRTTYNIFYHNTTEIIRERNTFS